LLFLPHPRQVFVQQAGVDDEGVDVLGIAHGEGK
jgi:hypothetical protein